MLESSISSPAFIFLFLSPPPRRRKWWWNCQFVPSPSHFFSDNHPPPPPPLLPFLLLSCLHSIAAVWEIHSPFIRIKKSVFSIVFADRKTIKCYLYISLEKLLGRPKSNLSIFKTSKKPGANKAKMGSLSKHQTPLNFDEISLARSFAWIRRRQRLFKRRRSIIERSDGLRDPWASEKASLLSLLLIEDGGRRDGDDLPFPSVRRMEIRRKKVKRKECWWRRWSGGWDGGEGGGGGGCKQAMPDTDKENCHALFLPSFFTYT